MAQKQEGGRVLPYIPFSTLTTFLQDLQEHGVPNRIDSSALTRFSGSIAAQLRSALRSLNLMDDASVPTEQLRILVKAFGTSEWPAALRKLLDNSYKFVIDRGLGATTPSEFSEAFRAQFPSSQPDVLRKCETFFVKAAQASGIEISPRLLQKTRVRRQSVGTKRNGKPKARSSSDGALNDPPPPPPPANIQTNTNKPIHEVLFDLLNVDDMNDDEKNAVWKLMQYLKRREAANPSKDKGKGGRHE